MKRKALYLVIFAVAAAGAASGTYLANRKPTPQAQLPQPPQGQSKEAAAIAADFKQVLAAYRKMVVLTQDEAGLSKAGQEDVNRVGQQLFHENQERIAKVDDALASLVGSQNPRRFEAVGGLLDYVESNEGLYDADRLAFRELMQSLLDHVAQDSSLPAIKLHKRISEDLDALAEIERTYEKEISAVFGRFESRSIVLKREKWDSYVGYLKTIYQRDRILKDYGVVLPYPAKPEPPNADNEPAAHKDEDEIFGNGLPKKTIVLTFDDGPHRRYSEEIAAILKQYDAPAVFFSVGRNLGTLDAHGVARLNAGAEVSRKLKAAGYVLANHSFSHAQLSKESGDSLKAEIFDTDTLLKAVDPQRSALFRFPYGARNKEGMHLLADAHLKSVMWNIDSLDWADPVPASIAERVLRAVDKEGRGIILFHDIHERTVKALPAILDRLVAEGYQFAGWDGTAFRVAGGANAAPAPVARAAATGYASSWAIVVGVDGYPKWPHLQYAVRDAEGVGQTLVQKFGFASDHVITLKNEQATRRGILAAFHDLAGHGGTGGLQPNDRVFVFFAGHGATRKLSSGRDLGYIVPYDADPENLASDAIPMTEIQNIAESLPAKHVLFVMDACYSGLGLTRGGANAAFLRDNARRLGRQMLTAGGTDQMVSDGGPNGHSVFTWTLLQGLGGKADLNGDGLITATELAAYVAPAVASVSQQTPAFGSLPGSEGGDFVFELPEESEFLNTNTAQLSNDAIALNTKLEAKASAPSAPVVVKDLQGGEQTIKAPAAVPVSSRQQAQRANDHGLQLYKEKQYAQAETQFTEALKLRPNFALAANNLGFVFYKQDKFAEAARWFENAIRMDPSRAIAYMNLGDAYARAGNGDKAKAAYKTYLELAPSGSGAGYAKQQVEKL
ncbi:polysaccharide deacetylase family protein [Massilia sp. Root335]|uniref:polysaccharide deacetylase family protein n=1 Tax=Massilia sp. Root335 TaxID=1736517 RepID=UPI0006F2C1D8|nr:polysaccharide deacetylase family protein [Massilia sp. Root335]KQV50046.1 polysaccharide deacetylase [Massilia sp. Root335]